MYPGCLTHYHMIIKHSSSIYNPLALFAAIAVWGRKDSFANARVIVYRTGLQIC